MRRRPISLLLPLILSLVLSACPAYGQKWSFAVVADNRSAFGSYRNVLAEIKSFEKRPDSARSPVKFVIGCGDIAPIKENDALYKSVLGESGVSFIPVRGNHEEKADVDYILKTLLPSASCRSTSLSPESLSYYVDWKNVRFLILDQYHDFGKTLNRKQALEWLTRAIESAKGIDHIFVAFHEPYLPDKPENDAFWSILLRYGDRIRAVFCGHTHVYERKRFPDTMEGMIYVNAGNAGWAAHSDKRQTIVEASIDGREVSFRALQAPDGKKDFKVMDEWVAGRAGEFGKPR